MSTASPSRPASAGAQHSTVGMKPLNASSAAGDGRRAPSAAAYDITAPIEKPPITVRSQPIPRSTRSWSNDQPSRE